VIDLHFHCLPGIDDGAGTWEEAVEMCRLAAADGTGTIVATPHVLRDGWLNEDAAGRDAMILKLNTLLGGRPSILPGCEYRYSSDVVDLVEKGESGPLTRLNRSRYLLMEFSPAFVPAGVAAALHELMVLNVVPVIAHPERNLVFARDPQQLESLVARGARTQLTAASFLGEFGRTAQAASEEFVRRGIAHAVASDAHSAGRRPPRLAAARERVRKTFGAELEAGLFESNPEAIVRNEPLPFIGKGAPAG